MIFNIYRRSRKVQKGVSYIEMGEAIVTAIITTIITTAIKVIQLHLNQKHQDLIQLMKLKEH
jgi:hypothetical protein